MILYVNGDSHSAGAEAVNPHAFAEDDRLYWALGRKPHPDNLRASYGCELANLMGAILECDAESASSNDRIFRTTQKYLQTETPDYLVIGWTTWEREEWTHNDRVYQVTASGTDTVPKELQTQYKEWVIEQSDPAVDDQSMLSAQFTRHDIHEPDIAAVGVEQQKLFDPSARNACTQVAPLRNHGLRRKGERSSKRDVFGAQPYGLGRQDQHGVLFV